MSKFKAPSIEEVAGHMQSKMGWPAEFCAYYAEKFWNHYQASGWKLSNGNSMKDWRAAFASNWKTIKFAEDLTFYNRCVAAAKASLFNQPVRNGSVGSEWTELDRLLAQYAQRPTSIPFEEFGKWYMLIAKNKLLINFSQEDIDEIKKIYEGDQAKCRCAAVVKTFDAYVMNGMNFSKIIETRSRLVSQ